MSRWNNTIDEMYYEAAILIISQDLDEILTLCEQIHVLSEGNLSAAVDMKDNGLEKISHLMLGSEKQ